MSTDDRLYDLQEAADHRFVVYHSGNMYVTPYSSDTHGGELITEFNQRAALNSLLKRQVNLQGYADSVASTIDDMFGAEVEVDSTTGETEMQGPGLNSFLLSTLHDRDNWNVTSYATGTQDEDSFNLSFVSGHLTVSSGVALIYGYYVHASTEISIEGVDAINNQEISAVLAGEGQNRKNPCRSKFVKLAVQYTANQEARHDERLLPPNRQLYPSVVVVINDELPSMGELLLGTVTRDSLGRFLITNNPQKSRLLPLDSIEGAENYDRLLSAIEDEHTYGVKFGSTDGSQEGSVTNLRNIDPWLWLHHSSRLAMLLRSMSTNEQTAGNATDEPTRGVIVSDRTVPSSAAIPVNNEFNCLQRLGGTARGSDPENRFAKVGWHQAQVPAQVGSDLIDYRALYLPYAWPEIGSNISARSGISKDATSPQADSSVIRPSYDPNTYPCLNGLNGNDGLMTYQQAAMLELVFSDYINRRSNGYARGRMFGPFLTLADAASWFDLYKPTVEPGDYFWVINDTSEAGGQEAVQDSGEWTYANIITNYGTVSGSVTGTAKQPNVQVKVTGSVTGEAEGNVEGTVTGETKTGDAIEGTVSGTVTGPIGGSVEGTGQGAINATVTGTVTGTLDSFVQNVSSRYVCIYKEPKTGDHVDWYFAHAVMNTDSPGVIGNYQILDKTDDYKHIIVDSGDSQHNLLFAVEAVERGFAVPATPNVYGLVKIGTGTYLTDVVLDNLTHRLRITDNLLNLVKNGGFETYNGEATEIQIAPGEDLSKYSYKLFSKVTFKMTGSASDWRANLDTTGTLAHIRGDITLDFSDVQPANNEEGLLLQILDIDYLTLKGRTPDTTEMLFGVNHCIVNAPFFTNIGRWEYSEFISGGDTLELNLPWMEVTDVFTNTIDNSLSCRFSSVTMGKDGVTSAMLDIWVKHAGWSNFRGNIDKMWSSLKYLNFPPLFFEHQVDSETQEELSSINPDTILYIPDNLNLKVSGTAGVHQVWDDNNSEYVPGGNFLINLNWEYNGNPSTAATRGGRVYLNMYMRNTSEDTTKHDFSNLRFRAPVQVIRLDDNSMSNSVGYDSLYPPAVTNL